MKKSKIAVIGATGFASERMLPELESSDVCEVVAVQGRDIDKVKSVAEKFGIQNIYTNISEMLAGNIYDLIYIATPPYLHFEHIQECIKSGRIKNILCEKPLALTAEELMGLQGLVSQKKDTCKLYVGHHIRHQSAIRELRELVNSKVIGEVLFAIGDWSYELDPNAQYSTWKLDTSKSGDSVMGDPGIHVIDTMYLLFGKPVSVNASSSSASFKTTRDNVVALLGYEDKQVVVRASQTTACPKNDLVIIGTKGRIEVENCFSQTYIRSLKIFTKDGVEEKRYSETLLYKNEAENILGFFNDGVPATTFEEAFDETNILIDINSRLHRGLSITFHKS